MKYAKIMIILVLSIFLLSVAGASASDVDDSAIKSDNSGLIAQSANNELIGDAVNG